MIVVSVAAPTYLPLILTQDAKRASVGKLESQPEKDAETTKETISMMLKIAARHEKSVLLLAASGCGDWMSTWMYVPKRAAELLKDCFKESEFRGDLGWNT